MAATKPLTFEQQQRIKRARYAKAQRIIHYFWQKMRGAGVADPEHDKEALARAIAQVDAASGDDWKQVAAALNERTVPSADTIALVKSELRAMAARIERAKTPDLSDEDLVMESMRQRGTGSVGAEALTEDE